VEAVTFAVWDREEEAVTEEVADIDRDTEEEVDNDAMLGVTSEDGERQDGEPLKEATLLLLADVEVDAVCEGEPDEERQSVCRGEEEDVGVDERHSVRVAGAVGGEDEEALTLIIEIVERGEPEGGRDAEEEDDREFVKVAMEVVRAEGEKVTTGDSVGVADTNGETEEEVDGVALALRLELAV
jgi:hypothetical protein